MAFAVPIFSEGFGINFVDKKIVPVLIQLVENMFLRISSFF